MTAQRLAMQGMQNQGGVKPTSVSSYASSDRYGSVDQLTGRGGQFRGNPPPLVTNRINRKGPIGAPQAGSSGLSPNQQMSNDFALSYNSYISQMQARVKSLQSRDQYASGDRSSNDQQHAFSRQLQQNHQQVGVQGQASPLDIQQQQQQNKSYELGNLYSSESDMSLSMGSFQQTEPSRSMSPSSDGTNTDSLVSSTSGLNVNAPVFQGQRRGAPSNIFTQPNSKDVIAEEESSVTTGTTPNTSGSGVAEGRVRPEVPALDTISFNLDQLNLQSYNKYDESFNSEGVKGESRLLPLFGSVEGTELKDDSTSQNNTPRSLRREAGSLTLDFPDKTILSMLEVDADSDMVGGVTNDDQFLNFLESPPDSARRSFTSNESKRRASNTSITSHKSSTSTVSHDSHNSTGSGSKQSVDGSSKAHGAKSRRSSNTSSNSYSSNSSNMQGGKRRPSNTSLGSYSSDGTLSSPRSRTSSGIETTSTSSPQTTIWKKLANPEKSKAFSRKVDDFVLSED